MTAIETLEKFFEELRKEDCTYSDLIKYLTKTQQSECDFIGRTNVHAHLNGIHQLANGVNEISCKAKISTNKLLKDFVVKFTSEKSVKMQCRMVKESALRKPDKNGDWGLNVASFKLLDKKES